MSVREKICQASYPGEEKVFMGNLVGPLLGFHTFVISSAVLAD